MGLEIEWGSKGIELDNLRLPVLMRFLFAAFSAGGCLGFYSGVLVSTSFLCTDQPEKRKRSRQFGFIAARAAIAMMDSPAKGAVCLG